MFDVDVNTPSVLCSPGGVVPLMRLESIHSNVSTLLNEKAPVHMYENTSNIKGTEEEGMLNKERKACPNAHTSLKDNSGSGANGSNHIETALNVTYEEESNIKDTEDERRLSKPRFSWHNPQSSPEDNSGGGGGGGGDMV